ncbi:23S rRNA (uracil-C(5))-methyltransferase RlmCD [Enhygromyxa salina]|uniref:23S rRNA (Uracil-C(5))-methyltransferase RlmCD n=1 Tax=Enhygromyxa salina TaxID=215803 RepID=A0A2S9XRV5_9BACT|nr:class I SAM-dependent RNA methyltransferase [Enhygromyxa salina]PRP95431.1 23S rRNA (uracil-C(5))-methyltransferase RlmCD [Enhygromyxa salina]
MLKVGDEVEVEVGATDARGYGAAPLDGRTVLVPGLFPGERGRVRVEALARHSDQAHAQLRELLRPSPARRELPCPRHEHAVLDREAQRAGPRRNPACGGCPLMALDYGAQLELERAWLEAAHGLVLSEPILGVGAQELGYRCSSKRIVTGRAGQLRLGSRAAGKRRGDYVADMHGCRVDHAKIRAAFDGLEQVANELGIEPWREDRRAGDLRYAWAKTNGEQVLLTLITGSTGAEASRAPELGQRLHALGLADGVAWSVQSSRGNAIRGHEATHVVGLERLAVEIGGVQIQVGALGFLQTNLAVAALAYRDLLGLAPGELGEAPRGRLAFDLYAGAGVTTRQLRARFDEVLACESHPESAAALGVEPELADAVCRRWREAGRATPDLVLANPPRAGLGRATCEALVELAAPRIHMMSCSAKTLAEDLRRLEDRYEVLGLRGYDMLPQTPHVELVAWLRLRAG